MFRYAAAGWLSVVSLVGLSGAAAPVGTLHLVLLGNPNAVAGAVGDAGSDEDSTAFGRAIQSDLDLIETVVADGLPNRYALKVYKITRPDHLSHDGVIRALEAVPTAPGDSVCFYFAGHGGYADWGNRGQVFDLTVDGSGVDELLVPRQAVVRALSRGPNYLRVLAVISDCCYAFIERGTTTVEALTLYTVMRQVPVRDSVEPPKRLLEQLFFKNRGVIEITSCRPDMAAYYLRGQNQAGGLFTAALADCLAGNYAERLGWAPIFQQVRKGTAERFATMVQDAGLRGGAVRPFFVNGVRQQTQTAFWFKRSTLGEADTIGRLGVVPSSTNVLKSVRPDSPAARAGFRRNDQLVAVNEYNRRQHGDRIVLQALRYAPLRSEITVKRQTLVGEAERITRTVDLNY